MTRSLLCLLSSCLLASGLLAQSSVWKISKGSNTLYIGGTCHLLRTSDYPLPKEFDRAYEQAASLVFEINPGDLADPAFANRLMAKSQYTDGRSLQTVLSEEAYSALEKQGQKSNLPIQLFDSMKPGMVVMMITMQEFAKQGVSQEGVDLHYYQRGTKDGKKVHALESSEYQIDLIANMGEGKESELVLFSLKDLDQIGSYFDQMVSAWRHGDLEQLNQLFIQDLQEFPTLYDDMIRQRNQNWIPELERMLQTAETEFVLVGAGHAAGKDGVLALLEQRGCTIEQIIVE
ncbi:TraB/GumN family protein [Coraliomargarita akajimensis]|uniref:GumN family protein n=1 Tax=Coraliomargarita akajimensis (strain DSM 45221 / IAM 15411 / JCM 23193 / KCTC 12865 / 04OKA010-24) TaxID=583355 RepID=D5ELZ5_CORAD|nr:TraB/GumN family protein [Coraliomargarita akajimensis]ADE55155.1 GumN family protein [Coraliomargarita akajimensis DSM 45221]